MKSIILAGAIALAFTLFATPGFIWLFKRVGWGQFIRDDGPQSHHTKRGTPTMGGIVIIVGAVLGYFFGHIIDHYPPTASGLLVIFMMVGMGFVGFIDDFTKTRKQRSLGLGGWAKIAGQAIVASAFAILAINFPDENGITPASLAISAVRDIPWLNFALIGGGIGVALFVLWVNLIVVSTTNGVNVADGLDGLASGSAILALTSYVVISFWQFNQSCFSAVLDPEVQYKCYEVRDSLDRLNALPIVTGQGLRLTLGEVARIAVADVVSHSDHLLRLACNVLVQHGETPEEREDARILLVVLDARSPVRAGCGVHDREGDE